ncbi:hypothetical protein ACLKAF_003917, partial [Escherichia coli]
NSHCIPSIIINNTVRSFQRSVMNTRALFPLLFTVASFSASAGNWAVKNGWCQTMSKRRLSTVWQILKFLRE